VLFYDQDTIGWVWEKSVGWTYFLEPREEVTQIGEAASGASVISIPGLLHLREFILEAAIRGPTPIPYLDMARGSPCGCDTLFIEEGSRGAPSAPDHECGPVTIAIEYKSCIGGPFMTTGPEHAHSIHLIECISSINEKKTLVFFFCFALGPEFRDGMNA
jgi:hypothetical protein